MFLCKYRGNVTARVMEESEIPPELFYSTRIKTPKLPMLNVLVENISFFPPI